MIVRDRSMEKPLHYIDYGTDICSSLAEGLSREWLVINGIGGYASGTIAGPLSRSYHGLLIAATKPPVSRMLMLSKLDETVLVNDQRYPLYSNLFPEGVVEPDGYTRIERFYLEYSIPVWLPVHSRVTVEVSTVSPSLGAWSNTTKGDW